MVKPKKEPTVQMESLIPAMRELERSVSWAYSMTGDRPENAPKVTVVIQTAGQKSACAWFAANRWSTREGESVHEITFCAEYLKGSPESIIATMVHETAHLWCHDMKINDCSNGGRHNKKFKEAAEMLGLVVEKQGTKGYADTRPSDALAKEIAKFKPDVQAFNLARDATGKKVAKESTTVKWTCGCTIVRASRNVEVDAKCGICVNRFEIES